MPILMDADDPSNLGARGGAGAKKGKQATSRSRAKAAQCKFSSSWVTISTSLTSVQRMMTTKTWKKTMTTTMTITISNGRWKKNRKRLCHEVDVGQPSWRARKQPSWPVRMKMRINLLFLSPNDRYVHNQWVVLSLSLSRLFASLLLNPIIYFTDPFSLYSSSEDFVMHNTYFHLFCLCVSFWKKWTFFEWIYRWEELLQSLTDDSIWSCLHSNATCILLMTYSEEFVSFCLHVSRSSQAWHAERFTSQNTRLSNSLRSIFQQSDSVPQHDFKQSNSDDRHKPVSPCDMIVSSQFNRIWTFPRTSLVELLVGHGKSNLNISNGFKINALFQWIFLAQQNLIILAQG